MNRFVQYKKGDIIAQKIVVHEALTGGMGQVYLCFDENGNPIALKTLQAIFSSDIDAQKSFKDELSIWVSLENHPNIVRCFGMEILEGQPFIIMEWVVGDEGQGTTLRDHLKAGPLNFQHAMDFVIDICRGLLHAQKKVPGIVHCDIKPENILITRGGIAKITDFGLASEGQARRGVSGTPHYMAPEQWTDHPLDCRTDIYAVGCIFFELLTGQTPFTASSINELRSQHLLSPIPIISHDLYAPQFIQDITKRCLAKDLDKRYQGVQELLTDLENVYVNLFNKHPKPLLENKNLTSFELVMKALAYLSVQQVDKAQNTLDLAIKESKHFLLAYVIRCELLVNLGKFDLALRDAECAIEIDPSSALAYLSRAVVFFYLPDYEMHAAEDIQKAFSLEPENPVGYILRSQLNLILGKIEDALSDIREVEKHMPSHWIIYLIRSQIYAHMQEWDLAQKDLEDFIGQSQYARLLNKMNVLVTKAMIHNAFGQNDLALEEVNQVIQEMPIPRFYLVRAGVFSSMRRLDDALLDINYALKLSPKMTAGYISRAIIKLGMMKPKDALDDLSIALEISPDFWLVHHCRAAVFTQLQRPDDVFLELNRVRQLTNDLPLGHLVEFEAYMGQAYILNKKNELGRKHLNLAVSLASKQPAAVKSFAFLVRGLTNVDMGLLQEASSDLKTALEYDNNSPQAYYGFGLLYIKLGDIQNAKVYFNQATKLGVNISYAFQVLASDDREKILKDILEKISTIDTFSKFETLRAEEPLLQDPMFAPMLQNIFSSAAEDAGLSEMPVSWHRILEWLPLSNFGR